MCYTLSKIKIENSRFYCSYNIAIDMQQTVEILNHDVLPWSSDLKKLLEASGFLHQLKFTQDSKNLNGARERLEVPSFAWSSEATCREFQHSSISSGAQQEVEAREVQSSIWSSRVLESGLDASCGALELQELCCEVWNPRPHGLHKMTTFRQHRRNEARAQRARMFLVYIHIYMHVRHSISSAACVSLACAVVDGFRNLDFHCIYDYALG